jgi:hypothetical protein
MLGIFKYTKEIQKKLGSKTMAEPWLHILVYDNAYAIWVWDTREVLEYDKTNVLDITGDYAKDPANDQFIGKFSKQCYKLFWAFINSIRRETNNVYHKTLGLHLPENIER